jgi:RNA polymerase sigma-70 factor, ECF subfamily
MSYSPASKDLVVWAGLDSLTDEELLVRLVAGEHDSLTVLFDRYNRLIYSVAVRILRDEAEAEDVVQTVFLNIFESATNFDPHKGTLKVWLLQYAYHRSFNRLRMLTAQGVYLWDELDATNERGCAPVMDAGLLCEQLLTRLQPSQRQVITLTYIEGLTAQEIATRQVRSVMNVRNDLYRGLAKLRSWLTVPVKKLVLVEPISKERKNHIVGARTI